MTNNDTPTVEQLVRNHLESLKSGLWKDVYGTDGDLKCIFESYLSLLDQLKIAKEALEYYQHKDLQNGTSKILSRAYQTLSKLTI